MGKLPRSAKIAIALIFTVFALTSLRAVLLPLILGLVVIGGYFYFRHPEKQKQFNSFFGGLPDLLSQKVRALLSKENRTALAIAVGSIAIVLAIVHGNNQPRNAENGKGSGPDIIRATEYYIPSSSYVQHSCPKGYSNRDDGWCYRK